MSEINYSIFIKSYWNYYLELEEQFISTKKFVEFDDSNFYTYSVEYLKLLQAVCSEIDVVAKILAEECDASFRKLKNINIQKWGYYIKKEYSNIENLNVIFNIDYKITPWHNWSYIKYKDGRGTTRFKLDKEKKTPEWWTAYNKVKHERTSHYKHGKLNYTRANQKNLINAFAALYILENLLMDRLNKENSKYKARESNLFKFD